jgi:hypothetical protein
MTEAYLGIEIPLEHNKWEDVYKFVTFIGNKRELLYTKDLFYAQLGLLLGEPLIGGAFGTLDGAIAEASLETIAFLLTLPALSKEWENFDHITSAVKYCRDDVALLLLQDGRYTKDVNNIYGIACALLTGGCSNSFLYLLEKFRNNISGNIEGEYIVTCCYGLEDVALKLRELDLDIRNEIEIGNRVFRFLSTGVIEGNLAFDIESNGVLAIIKSGYLAYAFPLISHSSRSIYTRLYQAISIALLKHPSIQFAELEPYLASDNAPKKLLEIMLRNSHHNVDTIRRLSALVSHIDRNKFIKQALSFGDWQYAKAMSEVQ